MSVAFKNLHQSNVREFAKQIGTEVLSHKEIAEVLKYYAIELFEQQMNKIIREINVYGYDSIINFHAFVEKINTISNNIAEILGEKNDINYEDFYSWASDIRDAFIQMKNQYKIFDIEDFKINENEANEYKHINNSGIKDFEKHINKTISSIDEMIENYDENTNIDDRKKATERLLSLSGHMVYDLKQMHNKSVKETERLNRIYCLSYLSYVGVPVADIFDLGEANENISKLVEAKKLKYDDLISMQTARRSTFDNELYEKQIETFKKQIKDEEVAEIAIYYTNMCNINDVKLHDRIERPKAPLVLGSFGIGKTSMVENIIKNFQKNCAIVEERLKVLINKKGKTQYQKYYDLLLDNKVKEIIQTPNKYVINFDSSNPFVLSGVPVEDRTGHGKPTIDVGSNSILVQVRKPVPSFLVLDEFTNAQDQIVIQAAKEIILSGRSGINSIAMNLIPVASGNIGQEYDHTNADLGVLDSAAVRDRMVYYVMSTTLDEYIEYSEKQLQNKQEFGDYLSKMFEKKHVTGFAQINLDDFGGTIKGFNYTESIFDDIFINLLYTMSADGVREVSAVIGDDPENYGATFSARALTQASKYINAQIYYYTHNIHNENNNEVVKKDFEKMLINIRKYLKGSFAEIGDVFYEYMRDMLGAMNYVHKYFEQSNIDKKLQEGYSFLKNNKNKAKNNELPKLLLDVFEKDFVSLYDTIYKDFEDSNKNVSEQTIHAGVTSTFCSKINQLLKHVENKHYSDSLSFEEKESIRKVETISLMIMYAAFIKVMLNKKNANIDKVYRTMATSIYSDKMKSILDYLNNTMRDTDPTWNYLYNGIVQHFGENIEKSDKKVKYNNMDGLE